ncbi:cytochrome c-type biogenesis protein [Roseateles cellulosilyticus]|uniref:Cytochrome c-type biogenesis protein n=1 Tax=Pelomonas cellulosilytica TaxID=2906762 RepID=A0ABS8XJ73_9BURK|nr:cytochrome c-type biogenesis protein [Pelomonas sp. P8]MCE4552909.1 cytochrome c-type biogenesis protein CcmH [Pelomonas sp. P8]
MSRLLAALLCLALTATVHADVARPLAEDPVVEARLLQIAQEVRCLVCQNESLAASQADLANDLRREIRAQIRQGKTDAQIMEFLVSRYGNFVRYRPPFNTTTLLLWLGPFVAMLAGVCALLVMLHRRHVVPPAALTDEERRRAAALLNGGDRC